METSCYTKSPIFLKTYANGSPSFIRQEIIDDPADWIFWRGNSSTAKISTDEGILTEIDKADNLSECITNNTFIPSDIRSVSYISDGRDLNVTVWLSNPFVEPPLNDTLDTFREGLNITISNTDLI
jgi:hypothetical protein